MKKLLAILISAAMLFSACTACGFAEEADDRAYIESVLNLANNAGQEWTYSASADAWTLSVVSAVAYPELPDQQGVSVCVPGAYVTGIDTDGDGAADVAAETAQGAVKGALVIDYAATILSENGQTYTASTAPLIMTTGAAGYGSQNNSTASTSYAKNGYVSIACGNRGKQDTATDADGNAYYTGDAPSCLVDQKAAARFVKYNILLGNLPGCADYLVVTGGSGGGAHATMFAATSNNPDFYDYQIEAGAVGVYRNADGSYDTTVTVNGEPTAVSDGAWGCVAYSAITSLYEADAAQAFEYYMDTTYDFNTPFQQQLAQYLSEAYMNYINGQNLSIDEAKVGFDLNADGDTGDTVALTIEYDAQAHPETNGYYGTYLDLYRAEFKENLQWYLDNLDYAEGWTWFDADGNAMSDEAVAAMTGEEKAQAFIEGRYAKGSTGGMGMMATMGDLPDGELPGGKMGNLPDGELSGGKMGDLPNGELPGGKMGNLPDGEKPDGKMGNLPDGELPGGRMGDLPDGEKPDGKMGNLPDGMGGDAVTEMFGEGIRDGGPMAGSTASAGGGKDSANYETFDEMAADYASDVGEIYAGDEYGKNIVALYNPLNYIGAEGTDDPAWTRVVMGAVEGDISMLPSLNLEIAWLNAGVDTVIEWQWDGGHVPSEVLGNSLALYVDAMYGAHVSGVETAKPAAEAQTANGTAETATGSDLSAWVDADDLAAVDFTLADVLAYRNSGATKAVPGFDVIDHGQENYVFGNETEDARHWNIFLNEIFQNEEYAQVLRELFNNAE